MHAILSEDQCHAINYSLVPVFEFIVTPSSLRARLRKAIGKDMKAIRKMMDHHFMTQYSLKAGLHKIGKEGEKAVSKAISQLMT